MSTDNRGLIEREIALLTAELSGIFMESSRGYALAGGRSLDKDVSTIPLPLLQKLHRDLASFRTKALAAEDAALAAEYKRRRLDR